MVHKLLITVTSDLASVAARACINNSNFSIIAAELVLSQ